MTKNIFTFKELMEHKEELDKNKKNSKLKKINEHNIFLEIDKYINFYNSIEDATFFSTPSGIKEIRFNSNFFYSMKETLNSIKILLKNGNINDAFTLLRKYQDVSTLHIYYLLYLEDNFSIDNLLVEKVNNWIKNKNIRIEYKNIKPYILGHKKTKKISKIILTYHQGLRDRLNGHTHYNCYSYLSLNENKVIYDNKEILDYLNRFLEDIRIIFASYFIWLFTAKEYYMASSDYVDYLDMGLTPPQDSQCWVAPFIQEIFDDIIKPNFKEVADELKKTTSMELN